MSTPITPAAAGQRTLPQLWADLTEARADELRTATIKPEAMRDHAEALSQLNRAQKAIDVAIKAERSRAPIGSDWSAIERVNQ